MKAVRKWLGRLGLIGVGAAVITGVWAIAAAYAEDADPDNDQSEW